MKRKNERRRPRKTLPHHGLELALRTGQQRLKTISWSEMNARGQALLFNGYGQIVGEIGRNYYGIWRGSVLRNFNMDLVGEYPAQWEAKRAVEEAYLASVKGVK